MIKFKKCFSIKIVSIIIIVSLLCTIDTYSNDTVTAIFSYCCKRNASAQPAYFNLRKPLDFNNKKEKVLSRYMLAIKNTLEFKNLQRPDKAIADQSKSHNLWRRENLLYGTVLVTGIATCIGLSLLFNGSVLGFLRQFLLLPFILSFYATLGNVIAGIFMDIDDKKPERLPYENLPFVTVQIPIRNERLDVLKISLDSALDLNYPKDKLEIQLIDNSDVNFMDYGRIKDYAESKGVIFIHRDGIEGLKAGNLNIGMKSAKGDYFLILDADSVVTPDSLLDALPEFFLNDKLGFAVFDFGIINSDANNFTKGLTYSESLNQVVLEPVRDRFGVVQFHGSNGIWKRETLEKIGGWNQNTFSEDFEASIDAHLEGYKGKLLTYVKSGKTIPETTVDFIKQRKRWAFWTIDLLFRKAKAIIFSKNMIFAQKADSLYRLSYYIGAAFIIPFSFIVLFIVDNPVLPFIILITQLPWMILVAYNFIISEKAGGFSALRENINNMLLSSQVATLIPVAAFEAIIALLTRDKKTGYFITPKISSGKIRFLDMISDYKDQFIIASLFIGLFFALVPYDIRIALYSPLLLNMSNMISAPFFFKEVRMGNSEANNLVVFESADIKKANDQPLSITAQKSNILRSIMKDASDNRRLIEVFPARLPLLNRVRELIKNRQACDNSI